MFAVTTDGVRVNAQQHLDLTNPLGDACERSPIVTLDAEPLRGTRMAHVVGHGVARRIQLLAGGQFRQSITRRVRG